MSIIGLGCAMAEPATPGQSRTLLITQLFAGLSAPVPFIAAGQWRGRGA